MTIIKTVTSLVFTHPEATVFFVYGAAILLNYIDYEPPLIGQFDLPLVVAVGVSLWYQFVVPAPQTGLQSVTDSLTYFIGFSVFAIYFVKRAFDIKSIMQ